MKLWLVDWKSFILRKQTISYKILGDLMEYTKLIDDNNSSSQVHKNQSENIKTKIERNKIRKNKQ